MPTPRQLGASDGVGGIGDGGHCARYPGISPSPAPDTVASSQHSSRQGLYPFYRKGLEAPRGGVTIPPAEQDQRPGSLAPSPWLFSAPSLTPSTLSIPCGPETRGMMGGSGDSLASQCLLGRETMPGVAPGSGERWRTSLCSHAPTRAADGAVHPVPRRAHGQHPDLPSRGTRFPGHQPRHQGADSQGRFGQAQRGHLWFSKAHRGLIRGHRGLGFGLWIKQGMGGAGRHCSARGSWPWV